MCKWHIMDTAEWSLLGLQAQGRITRRVKTQTGAAAKIQLTKQTTCQAKIRLLKQSQTFGVTHIVR